MTELYCVLQYPSAGEESSHPGPSDSGPRAAKKFRHFVATGPVYVAISEHSGGDAGKELLR